MNPPLQRAEYSDLEQIKTSLDLVYGPIASDRLGTSLGVNLCGAVKLCSFDCPYCDLGLSQVRMNQIKKNITFPTGAEIDKLLREKLRDLIAQDKALAYIAISGNGEPTLHPDFFEITESILKARNEIYSQAKVILMTNGAHFDVRKNISAANLYDERMLKVDAGSDKILKSINQPLIRMTISRLLNGAKSLKDVVAQCMFVQGAVDNTRTEDIDEWIEVVGMLAPKAVHITTLTRVPAISGLKKVSEDELYTIASRLKKKTQLESVVLP